MFDEIRMADLEGFIKKQFILKQKRPMLFIISEEHEVDEQKFAEMRTIEILSNESNLKNGQLKLFLELDNFRYQGSKMADFFPSKVPTWTSMAQYVKYHGGEIKCIDTAYELRTLGTSLRAMGSFFGWLAVCNHITSHFLLKWFPPYTILFVPLLLYGTIAYHYKSFISLFMFQFKFMWDDSGMQPRNEQMIANIIASSNFDYGIVILGAAHTPPMLKKLYDSQKFDLVHLAFSEKYALEALNSPISLPVVPEFHMDYPDLILITPSVTLAPAKESKVIRRKVN